MRLQIWTFLRRGCVTPWVQCLSVVRLRSIPHVGLCTFMMAINSSPCMWLVSYVCSTFQSALQKVATSEAAKDRQTQCGSMREAHPAEGRNMWAAEAEGHSPELREGPQSNKVRQNGKLMKTRRSKRE